MLPDIVNASAVGTPTLETSDSPFDSFTELLEKRAADSPLRDAVLFVTNGTELTHRLTYSGLLEQVRDAAARLRSLADRGDRVLLVYDSGPDFVVMFFACQLAGLVPVPVSPPRSVHTWERAIAIICDCNAKLAFTDDNLLDAILRHALCGPAIRQLHWFSVDTLRRDVAPSNATPSTATPGSLAFLQYTSGSTAKPRGVRVTHGNLLHNSAAIQEAFGHDERCLCVSWLPVFHDMGLIGGMLQGIYVGYPSVMMPQFEFITHPIRWLRAVDNFKASVSGGPNFAYAYCSERISDADVDTLDLSSWRVAFSGAEVVHADTLDRFAAKFSRAGFRYESFIPCYGLAESTLFVTGKNFSESPTVKSFSESGIRAGYARHSDDPKGDSVRIVSCGRPFRGQQIGVVDPETKSALRDGQIGEIWTSGPSVAAGYWDDKLNAGVFVDAVAAETHLNRELYTGDLGFIEHGQLYLVGRQKDLIKIRGQNYFPEDIEHAAAQIHSAIRPGSIVATSICAGVEERCILLAELDRGWLRAVKGSSIVRTVVQPMTYNHDDMSDKKASENDVAPLAIFGLPKSMARFTTLALRPIFRSSPSRDHIPSRIISWAETTCSVIPILLCNNELMRPVSTMRDMDAADSERFEPLEVISATLRDGILTHSRLLIDAVIFLMPGSIPKTSSGKLRRAACRDAFIDGKLEILADLQLLENGQVSNPKRRDE